MRNDTAAAQRYNQKKSDDNGKFFAKVPRKVILHRIETAESLDDRLYWAIVLASWCGPHVSEYAALKDNDGFFSRIAMPVEQEKLVKTTSPDGQKLVNLTSSGEQKLVKTTSPIAAKCIDLLRSLGLSEGMQGNASRSLARLEAKGCIRREDGKIYPVKDPVAPAAPVEPEEPIVKIGKLTIMSLDLDRLSPERREEFKALVTRTAAEFDEKLAQIEETRKTCVRNMENLLREQVSEFGIIIDFKSKRIKRDSSSSSLAPVDTVTTTKQGPLPSSPPMQAPSPPAENLTSGLPPDESTAHRLVQGLSNDNEFWDVNAVTQLWNRVRVIRPKATVGQIVHAASVKRMQMRSTRIKSWIGFLLTAIPEMAASPNWQVIELYVKHTLDDMLPSVPEVQAVLDDPEADEYAKNHALEFLKKVELLR